MTLSTQHVPGHDSIASRTLYVGPGKRFLDVTGSLILLASVVPALFLIAVVLRLTLGRGVIFRQTRMGRDGVPFAILKFRTMQPDRRTQAAGAALPGLPDRRFSHKTVTDPRHTPVGRFLRRTSLDELPQLINVLRGDMSLVGPRPELVHLVGRMDSQQVRRHSVRPGITGVWQVKARSTLLLHEAIDLEIAYIVELSFVGDLRLLLRTPGALIHHPGS